LALILKENSDLKVAARKAKHGYHQNYNASRTLTHILEAVTLSDEGFAYQQLLSVQNPDYGIHINHLRSLKSASLVPHCSC